MNKIISEKPIYKKLGIYEITLNEKNLRKISKKGFERLKKKILEGIYKPILVWKKNNVVLSGNQRLAVIRHLVENEGYKIADIDCAIYDVDEKKARFIEACDNVNEGEYDFEKMIENYEDIEEFDMKELFEPSIAKKLDAKLIDNGDIEIDDVPKEDFGEVVEITTRDIIISNVPKTEALTYYDVIEKAKKATGKKNEWKCLKAILDKVNAIDMKDFLEV